MRMIDADALKSKVLKWMPSDPCGIEEREFPFEADIVASLMMEIEEAPTIEPEPHWIPCSERLPEENEVVLTQARFADDIKMAVSARIDYNYWTGWGTREVNVVAWMPLPSLWKGDK